MLNILEIMLNRNKKKKQLLAVDTSLSPSASVLSPATSSDTYSLEDRDSRDILKVFRYIDENGDGKISAAELQRSVKAVGAQQLSAEEAAVAVESWDSDGDGLLSLEDLERLVDCKGVSEEEKNEDLREAFLMYKDKTEESEPGQGQGQGQGVITPKSLKKMLSRLGDSKSINECKAMIHVYDINGDGVLSFDEFAVMMR